MKRKKTGKTICMDKSAILILSNSSSGLYSFRKELIIKLLSEGRDVFLSLPKSDDNKLFTDLGCKVSEMDFNRHGKNPFQELKLMAHYKKIIQEINPKVVLSYTIKPNVYGGIVCKIKHIPYICNISGLGTAIENGGLLSAFACFLYKISLKKAEMVFFQNSKNRDFMLKHKIVKGRCEVLPGSGVNLTENKFEEYPKNDGEQTFITVGRIMKDKGIDELLSAAETLKKRHPNIRFRLVGDFDEDYENEVKNAERDGIIEYLGYRKDVHDLISDSHATIHPSYHEGMSNVLLESAACGRPVIASDVHGCRETFDDGISGIAFEPKSVDALVEAVEKFISLPYEKKVKMGLAGRKKVEKEFDRQIVVDSYIKEIKRIEDKENGAL